MTADHGGSARRDFGGSTQRHPPLSGRVSNAPGTITWPPRGTSCTRARRSSAGQPGRDALLGAVRKVSHFPSGAAATGPVSIATRSWVITFSARADGMITASTPLRIGMTRRCWPTSTDTCHPCDSSYCAFVLESSRSESSWIPTVAVVFMVSLPLRS